ncbi:UNKNOWN [Stylonychia lemnae]|uniref:Uncharacterized protein n=1 Tax=Stylonychia lemnae TaxID=5949 RepID=A0A078B0K3_STYLE|nr:UNKNOWN [Stylonychia lemnae]|eukprot:CDW86892.1 UNKNOWN [Stylonychia lemnae]
MESIVESQYTSIDEFINCTPEKQADIVPIEDWSKIEIEEKIKVDWHPHPLKKRLTTESNGWACDGKKQFVKCLSGITGFYQTAGVEGWKCPPCDFDLCKKCVQVSLMIERWKERED